MPTLRGWAQVIARGVNEWTGQKPVTGYSSSISNMLPDEHNSPLELLFLNARQYNAFRNTSLKNEGLVHRGQKRAALSYLASACSPTSTCEASRVIWTRHVLSMALWKACFSSLLDFYPQCGSCSSKAVSLFPKHLVLHYPPDWAESRGPWLRAGWKREGGQYPALLCNILLAVWSSW